ncbi:Spermidine coumaroyl CoA acyltransferase [Spatholobus suberectus]|nr:Spermidine coumaroyl CoA acyltransferase [Spatholobus suberectus]
MAYKNPTLTVENKEVTFIKPSRPTPTTVLSLSSIDNAPENNIFMQTLHVYRSPNHNSPNTTKLDPANVIKEALSKALFYYYRLAGKLVTHADGKLRVNCNSEGVPFIEAACNCDLSSLHYLDGNDVETAKQFAVDFPFQDEFGNQYPLVFKVTKFLCGGFTIVMRRSHAIFDGTGASQFLKAVAELASGKTEPSVKPVWERERLVGTITSQPVQNPMDKATVAVSPFLPSTEFSHVCSKVGSVSIARLKMSLMK